MGNGFHDEDELYDMQKHPSVQAIRIGRTKPYECSYPLPEPYRESEPHKQTNADRIRNMTDEELAMAIMCPAEFTGSDKVCDFSHDCKDCTLSWLQKESEAQ